MTYEREVYAPDDYIDMINGRILEINLRPNPSIEGNLIRALRRTISWDVSMGVELKRFVDENLTGDVFERICYTEKGLYPEVLIGKFDRREAILEYCFYRSGRKPAHSHAGFQFELPI